jgi:hypothetical protein
MKGKRTMASVLIVLVALFAFSSCSKKAEVVSEPVKAVTEPVQAETAAVATTEPSDKVDLSEKVSLKFNLSYGNKSRTMTYNQSTPLTLSDGDVVTAGMLKPMWTSVEQKLNSEFQDVSIQDAKAVDMIKTESTSSFSGANIYGGNSIATELMSYGADGKFVNLKTLMNDGYMPNFKAYLDKNPNVKASITAFDGNIYQVPYIAEIGEIARTVVIRGGWVTALLDNAAAAFDTRSFNTFYKGFYIGDKARYGANGGSVEPKAGLTVNKKTKENIIEIQNALPVKNGKTLTQAMITYIKNNYDYAQPSELFLGEKAAYDVDEMIALFRCIKANGSYLTNGATTEVWPFFTRQSSYREDLLRFATYFDGVRVHGSDSYEARWYVDKNGDLQYSYTQEALYDILCYFSDMQAEGLLYSDFFDLSNKANHRTALWGTDASTNPRFGFMTYDWIASSTADSLTKETEVILPPVAKVNGVWQYYLDNSRVIKSDGWAISVAGSNDKQIKRAAAVMDYFFTEEGAQLQNFGLPQDIETTQTYAGPDGKAWPMYKSWMLESSQTYAKGDLSSFLRDWIGSQMPIGYQKVIGFEYQSTSAKGFDGWKLLKRSTVGFPTYSGEGLKGENDNYYTLLPSAYSLTPRQNEFINDSTSFNEDLVEYMFNVIRYKTLGNAPSGAAVAKNYAEYLKYFTDRGLEAYVQTYRAAYENMRDSQ